MAKEKDSVETEINGFTALFEGISPGETTRETEDVHDMSKGREGEWMNRGFNPDEELDDDTSNNTVDNDDDDDDDDDTTDESKVVPEISKRTKEVETPTKKDDVSNVEDEEGELVEPFFDLFTQELGWETEEDDKPKSIKDLVEYMKNVVEVNSSPKFASDEIASLNEYVKNGGNIDTYYEVVNTNGINLETVNLESERDQRDVVREVLAEKGYKKERIERMLERYETAETLRDEAEDAVEELRELRETKKERLLEEQANAKQQETEQQQAFFTTVENSIKDLNDVRGITISNKDKQELLEYIFKPESDGRTRYQKEYMKSHRNLIESAFFTMKGDKLVKAVEQKATSDAVRNLKDKLRSKKVTRSSTSTNFDEARSVWDLVGGQLQKP